MFTIELGDKLINKAKEIESAINLLISTDKKFKGECFQIKKYIGAVTSLYSFNYINPLKNASYKEKVICNLMFSLAK